MNELTGIIAASIATTLRQVPERWIQGQQDTFDDRHCLVGFILQEMLWRQGRSWREGMAFEVVKEFDRCTGAEPPPGRPWGTNIITWNDAPGRTVNDVIALCDEIAAHHLPATAE